MRIAYHYPAADTIYAQRTIHNGFRRAFEDLGHSFHTFSPPARLTQFLNEHHPDVFITASHFFYRRQLDYAVLSRFRESGMTLLTKIDFWDSPLSGRINEAKSLKDDAEAVRMIRSGLLGDHFFHVVEQGDARMDGLFEATGRNYVTIPLAADKTMLPVVPDPNFQSDAAFVGTRLPAKERFFEEALYPIGEHWKLRIYGQDWTRRERALGFAQKLGQYLNLPRLRAIQRPKLTFAQELAIYRTASISLNIHEEYQRRFGGDCNERTFKIPLAGGFEITDDVACIRRYFEDGVEIVIATDPTDWLDKVAFYLRNPEARAPIVEAGRARVLREHTYHDRARQILALHGGADVG
jgi:spore maturation protein CgeB